MCMYSGLDLSYWEGWVLYVYEDGQAGVCYHAWNEYADGSIMDVTWGFEFYPLWKTQLGLPQRVELKPPCDIHD